MRRFVIDNQLPAKLASWLEARGFVAEHVLDLQLAQAPDDWIWKHAVETGAVIVSKDEDFARMTLLRPEPVTVLWLRIGNCRTGALLHALERTWPAIELQIEQGARLIEVL